MLKKIILGLDGYTSFNQIESKLNEIYQLPRIWELVSHIKINDIVYNNDGCMTMSKILDWKLSKNLDVGIFLDLKLSDTSGTNMNIINQYLERGLHPDILTIRESCSSKTFKSIRGILPYTTLALVSVLTDTSEDECFMRYGMSPQDKIIRDTSSVNSLCPGVLDAIVCSPHECKALKEKFPDMKLISPGIRDHWMNSGQQKRHAGVKYAINEGADYLVMVSQLTKGNPDKNISPQESIELTINEILS